MLRLPASLNSPQWSHSLPSNGQRKRQRREVSKLPWATAYLAGSCLPFLARSAVIAGSSGLLLLHRTRRKEAVCWSCGSVGSHATVLRALSGSSPKAAVSSAKDAFVADAPVEQWDEEEEYSTYGCLGTHREMIEDESRTEAFREAIFATCKGKKVLEVGCGTGILSAFAAQAGATCVVAVEADAQMAQYAREVMEQNGLNEVVVIEGRVEDCQDQVDLALITDDPFALPRVDVLISEWMGFMLVCEDMFPSVAFARECWLRPGGVMLPMECSVWAAPVCMRDHLNSITGFWEQSQYGVDFSPLAAAALEQHTSVPVVTTCGSDALLSRPVCLWTLDCQHSSGEETRYQSLRFQCEVTQAGRLQGLALWFRCKLTEGVEFGTGPMDQPTHWEQVVLFVDPEYMDSDDIHASIGSSLQGAVQWESVGDVLDVRMAGEVQGPPVATPAVGSGAFRFARRLVLHITS